MSRSINQFSSTHAGAAVQNAYGASLPNFRNLGIVLRILLGVHVAVVFAVVIKSPSLLTLGDYPRGFQEYEWRWTRTGMAGQRRFRAPLWTGEQPLAGKTILVHAEQGLEIGRAHV